MKQSLTCTIVYYITNVMPQNTLSMVIAKCTTVVLLKAQLELRLKEQKVKICLNLIAKYKAKSVNFYILIPELNLVL